MKVKFLKAIYPYAKGDIGDVTPEQFKNFPGYMEEIKEITNEEVEQIQKAQQSSIPGENKSMKKSKVSNK